MAKKNLALFSGSGVTSELGCMEKTNRDCFPEVELLRPIGLYGKDESGIVFWKWSYFSQLGCMEKINLGLFSETGSGV